MRGKLGPILVGLGAFLLVAALLLKVFAYPQLAVAPIDQESVTELTGPGATVFDTGTLSEITTDLTTTANTVGDIEASQEQGDNVRVWVNTSSTRSDDGVVRSRSIERVAFDAHTGEAVDCCGTYAETVEGQPEEVTFEGLVFKFPFGTQKESYDFWDSTLLRAVPIAYVDTEDVEGVETYRFEHVIEPTVTGTMEAPASILGEEAEGNLEAERTYSNTRTLWVEPRTGVILKRAEAQLNTLRYDGEDRVTLTEVTTGYTDETVKANAEEYGSLGNMLHLVNVVLPLVLGVLGLVAIIGGALLLRRRQEPAHA
ncbi:DUF3068 domain-containing protein [Nocardioides sp.]|uniref:DUF3068 domain-containing protein n=1 Tax=Nocardioides sp. TaxID=35761 RepID=UPI002732AC07|nr:DUF3068 domain-containing protein [Nocardioides sp.]MDP3890190.1 DUF3068 domain-containing protein [Nocardioides sp.]